MIFTGSCDGSAGRTMTSDSNRYQIPIMINKYFEANFARVPCLGTDQRTSSHCAYVMPTLKRQGREEVLDFVA